MKLNFLIFQGVSHSPLCCELWWPDLDLEGQGCINVSSYKPGPNSRTQKGGHSGDIRRRVKQLRVKMFTHQVIVFLILAILRKEISDQRIIYMLLIFGNLILRV